MGGDQEDHPLRTADPQVTLELEYRDLSPETAPDLFSFFDGPAFADFPHWRTCNCFFYNFSGSQEEWSARSGEQNRAAKLALIDAGLSNGVLAYHGGKVAGWCHADRRSHLGRLDDDGPAPDAATMGAVVCFVVDPGLRRQGVATGLLAAAVDRLRRLGVSSVEGYPPAEPARSPLPPEQTLYHGPRSLYHAAGFREVERRGLFLVMRKTLV